jgi:hypothetical protein
VSDVRIHWTVTLWGPRAADNPEHSVAGSGKTPAEALASLLARLHEKQDLNAMFLERARKEQDK